MYQAASRQGGGGGEEDELDLAHCRKLAAGLGLPEALVAVLLRRGLASEPEINRFLQPSLADLPDPDLLLGMNRAVELLTAALGSRQPIVVYADYDVDGLTAGALVYIFLRQLGHQRLHYLLPHRVEDGYGVHARLLAGLREKLDPKARPLLITVDCGITDHQALAAARELGYTVIVTDHHRPSAEPSPADAVLNPHQAGCPFPCKNLAGVGVAFYLLMGLRRRLSEEGFFGAEAPPNLKEYLDLVALGTVADMVPLRGSNRILVRAGLEVMRGGRRTGLAALAKAAGVDCRVNGAGGNRPLYSEDISFTLAPRLNAAGRVASPETAFRLLITDQEHEATALAAELEDLNRWRRELSAEVYQQARQQAEQHLGPDCHCLVLADENWHPGVLGIAATRLQQECNRPVILLGKENDSTFKGSGRSVENLDLLAAVTECRELLLGCGGHAGALGLSLEHGKLEAFRHCLNEEAGRQLAAAPPAPPVTVDWFFQEGRIDKGLTSSYHLLEPFGSGNPEPLFNVRGVLGQPGVVGQNHLRFRWQQQGLDFPGIGFGFGTAGLQQYQGKVDLVFALRRNFYQGRMSWQLQAKSIKPAL